VGSTQHKSYDASIKVTKFLKVGKKVQQKHIHSCFLLTKASLPKVAFCLVFSGMITIFAVNMDGDVAVNMKNLEKGKCIPVNVVLNSLSSREQVHASFFVAYSINN